MESCGTARFLPFAKFIEALAAPDRSVRQLQDREMEKNDKKFWFPAMKYGVGWGFPVTW